MLGGEEYVRNSMADEFIAENILRNVRGAAEINGKIGIVVSDKKSEEELKKILQDRGLNQGQISRVEFSTDKDLVKNYAKMAETSQQRQQAKVLKEVMDLGPKKAGELRFKNYCDIIKLLAIYSSNKGQLVEYADLDNAIDIKKNLRLSPNRDEQPLGVTMGLIRKNPLEEKPSFVIHDMSKEELGKYAKENANNPNEVVFTNQRSYFKGLGGDELILTVVDYANSYPHYPMLAVASMTNNPSLKVYRSESEIPEEVRQNLIEKSHCDRITETSLLNEERVSAGEVHFEKMSKEEKAAKKSGRGRRGHKRELRGAFDVDDSIDSSEVDLKNPANELDLKIPADFLKNSESRLGENNQALAIPSPSVSSPSAFPFVALALACAAFVGKFLASKLSGGAKNNDEKNLGR